MGEQHDETEEAAASSSAVAEAAHNATRATIKQHLDFLAAIAREHENGSGGNGDSHATHGPAAVSHDGSSNSSSSAHLVVADGGAYDDDTSGNIWGLIYTDTGILLGSLIVMIALGLVLRKAFLYFAHVRERRERYHGGLKQIAEHMNVVTRTLSADPTGGARPRSTRDLPLSIFPPVTSSSSSSASSSLNATPMQLRRLQSLGLAETSLSSPSSRPTAGAVPPSTTSPLPLRKQAVLRSLSPGDVAALDAFSGGLTRSKRDNRADARKLSRIRNYLDNLDP